MRPKVRAMAVAFTLLSASLLALASCTDARALTGNHHVKHGIQESGAIHSRVAQESCDWSTIEQNLEDPDENLSTRHKAFRLGSHLTCMMNQPNGFDSAYTDYTQLEGWGWTDASSNSISVEFLNLRTVLNSLAAEAGTDRSRWGSVGQTHRKPAREGDFPPTGAQYNNYVNLKDGIVVGYRNDGPIHVNSLRPQAQRVAVNRITKLRNFSDVFFLGLQKYALDYRLDISSIQHAIQYQITNEETIGVLQSIIGREEPEAHKTWSNAYVYAIKEPQAKAAIATTNGRGVAWFLGQHKATGLGVKIIDRVKIWNCAEDPDEDWAEWCMYFHIVQALLDLGQLR